MQSITKYKIDITDLIYQASQNLNREWNFMIDSSIFLSSKFTLFAVKFMLSFQMVCWLKAQSNISKEESMNLIIIMNLVASCQPQYQMFIKSVFNFPSLF